MKKMDLKKIKKSVIYNEKIVNYGLEQIKKDKDLLAICKRLEKK